MYPIIVAFAAVGGSNPVVGTVAAFDPPFWHASYTKGTCTTEASPPPVTPPPPPPPPPSPQSSPPPMLPPGATYQTLVTYGVTLAAATEVNETAYRERFADIADVATEAVALSVVSAALVGSGRRRRRALLLVPAGDQLVATVTLAPEDDPAAIVANLAPLADASTASTLLGALIATIESPPAEQILLVLAPSPPPPTPPLPSPPPPPPPPPPLPMCTDAQNEQNVAYCYAFNFDFYSMCSLGNGTSCAERCGLCVRSYAVDARSLRVDVKMSVHTPTQEFELVNFTQKVASVLAVSTNQIELRAIVAESTTVYMLIATRTGTAVDVATLLQTFQIKLPEVITATRLLGMPVTWFESSITELSPMAPPTSPPPLLPSPPPSDDFLWLVWISVVAAALLLSITATVFCLRFSKRARLEETQAYPIVVYADYQVDSYLGVYNKLG